MPETTVIAECVECGTVWLRTDETRWSMFLTDDEPPEAVFYCPSCAEHEFGED